MKACRIINIKAGRVGGLSQAVMIHDLCNENRMPVWCGGMLVGGAGRASNLSLAALPNFVLPRGISPFVCYYVFDITNVRFGLNSVSAIDLTMLVVLGIS